MHKRKPTQSLCLVWHIHQPTFIPDTELQRQILESYAVIIRLHGTYRIPLALNITGALLERFVQLAPELVDEITFLMHEGLLELTGTGYYHPLFPVLTEMSGREQILKDLRLKKEIFADFKPKGFWPTDLGWVPWLVPVLAELGFQWSMVDSPSFTQGHALPTWQSSVKQGVKVLEPEIQAVSLSEELQQVYQTNIDDSSIKILVRDHVQSLALSDFETGVIFHPDQAESFVQNLSQLIRPNGNLVLAEDGERINAQTALGYEAFLQALSKSDLTVGQISEVVGEIDNPPMAYFPTGTFQADLVPWTSTPDDYAFLQYLRQVETTVQFLNLHLAVNPSKTALDHQKKAWQWLLQAEDSGYLFWKFHARTRLPGWQALRQAMLQAEAGLKISSKR